MIFDPDRHKMGKLCTHGHDHNNTGLSIRHKNTGTCVICSKEQHKRWRTGHKQEMKERSRRYYLLSKIKGHISPKRTTEAPDVVPERRSVEQDIADLKQEVLWFNQMLAEIRNEQMETV